MAELTFKDSVQTITGTVTSSNALNKWLQDGAWDIINRVEMVNPSKLQSFGQEQSITNDTHSVDDKIILGVYSNESEYREIPPALKIKAAAGTSIHAATSTNPVYYKENGKLALLPTGNTTPTVSLIDIDSTNLIDTNKPSEISYFPDRMKHLISIYAAMQQIQFLIKSKQVPLDSEIDLSSVPLPILPITSTASSNMNTWDGSAQSRIIIDNTTLADAPTYNSPVLEGRVKFVDYVSGFLHLDADPGVLDVQATAPVSPVLDLITIDSSEWVQPTFIAPIFDNPDWSNTDNWIEIEEDPEMLAARVQEISAKAAEFSSLLQEAKMRFDKDNTIFQSQIQESLQNAQLAGSKEGQEIQKFSTEQSDYQAKVNAEIGEYTQKLSRYGTEMQTALTAWSKEESDKVSRFAAELQNSLNEFNENNAEYAAKLQIALENARLSSAADGILMQRYASDLQSYQAEVASKIQEYTAKVQARTLEYQWLQEQHARLQNQYEKGFVPFQPPKEKD